MLKAKNILIIFLVNYLLILLACSFIELVFISKNAQQVQLLMQTAADMALEQVQATDDFFVTGQNYLINSEPYKIMAPPSGEGQYKEVEMFPAVTGKNSFSEIYNTIFPKTDMNNYITNECKGAVLPTFVGAATITKGNAGGSEYGDFLGGYSTLENHWYNIPKIYQMGVTQLNLTKASDIEEAINKQFIGTYSNVGDDLSQLLTQYDLSNAEKEAVTNTGKKVPYYFTPLSLGITYINEELLENLFINNLDLLMRTKYANSGINLNSENGGLGILKTAIYPNIVDADNLNKYNPINNGSFTLLRGSKKTEATTKGVEFFNGTVKPKVEYLVVDMYDNSPENNKILQKILGPRFTNNPDPFHVYISGDKGFNPKLYAGEPITGSILKEIDREYLESKAGITGCSTDMASQHKAMIVAKVTFYADFIIPYNTVSLREFRGREVDGVVTKRKIFNAFSNSGEITGASAVAGNYCEMWNRTGIKNEDLEKVYTSEYLKPLNREDNGKFVERLDGEYHSDAMAYTTYFAVTP